MGHPRNVQDSGMNTDNDNDDVYYTFAASTCPIICN